MNYPQLFKHAWKLIWSNWRIWLFSLIITLSLLSPVFRQPDLVSLFFIGLLIDLLISTVGIISQASIMYSIYNQENNHIPSFSEALKAGYSKFFRLVLSIVIFVTLSIPLLILYLLPSFNADFPYWLQLLLALPFSFIVLPIMNIIIITIMVSDLGMFSSLKNSLIIYIKNNAQILKISFIFFIIDQVFVQTSGLIILAFESGFSFANLGAFRFGTFNNFIWNSQITVISNFIFRLIITPITLAVYTLAYLKFTKYSSRPTLETTDPTQN